MARLGLKPTIHCSDFPCAAIIGEVDIIDCVQDSQSIWAENSEGVYHWVLANPTIYKQPVFGIKGKLSFWEI